MPFLDKLHKVKIEPGEHGYERGEEYRLTKKLRYYWKKNGLNAFAEVGAVNNGASIPRWIPDALLDDHGLIDKPVVLHDDAYTTYLDIPVIEREAWEKKHGRWTKRDADELLRTSLKDEQDLALYSSGLHGAQKAIRKAAYFSKRWAIWAGVKANLKASREWGASHA